MSQGIAASNNSEAKSAATRSTQKTFRRSNTTRPDFMIKKQSASQSENSPTASDRVFKRSSSIFKGKVTVSRMHTQEEEGGHSTRQMASARPALKLIANRQQRTRFDSPIRNLKPQRGVEVVEPAIASQPQPHDGKLLGKVVRELKAQLSRLNETDKEIEQALQYQYSIPTYLSNIYVHYMSKLMRFTKENEEVMAEIGQQLKSSISHALKTYQNRRNLLSETSFQTLVSPFAPKTGKQDKGIKESKPNLTLRKVKSEKLRFSIAPIQVEDSAGRSLRLSPDSKQTAVSELQSSLPSTDSPGICSGHTATAFFSHQEQRKPKFTLRPSLKTQPNTIEFTRLQSQFSNALDSEPPQIKIKRTVRFLDVEIDRPAEAREQRTPDRQ